MSARKRKQGEVHRQYISRLEALLDNANENNRALRAAMGGDQVFNPRTGNKYKDEAQFMFTSLALIEAEIRGTDCNELVLNAVRETLEQLGFNIVAQYENKCLKDGAYNA